MLGDMTPFRLAGNVYFVGTYAASSHMIDTGDGLILIDVGYTQTADVVIESLETLGYDVRDVKYILLSHGHHDHSDGVPKIVERSGAKVYLFEDDVRYLHGFRPDVYLHDGDVIRLGSTEILCLWTPGHTVGTASFFFDVTENGQTYRAGMFGGAGTKQLSKTYLDEHGLSYQQRGQFFRSIQRLRGERVDIFIGNHSWQNHTRENYEKSLTSAENPFIDPTRWDAFLDETERKMEKRIAEESRTEFVNYAHRGASEYLPENTFLSFYTGIYMGANGIETDVRRAKDGTLVLFHDKTMDRVCVDVNGAPVPTEAGGVEDYTYAELQQFTVQKNGFGDKIVRFEDFLRQFAFRDITFAIELKGAGVEEETADLLRKYHMAQKTVVTSFKLDYIKKIKAYAPELRVGLLTKAVNDTLIADLKAIGADEICPQATLITPEAVHAWQREGFRVRAWGLNHALMPVVCDAGADGMTVNFPDELTAYLTRSHTVE